jgi:hypothetical protein
MRTFPRRPKVRSCAAALAPALAAVIVWPAAAGAAPAQKAVQGGAEIVQLAATPGSGSRAGGW